MKVFLQKYKTYLAVSCGLVLVLCVVAYATHYVRKRAYEAEHNEANKTIFSADAAAAYVDMNGNQASLGDYRGSILVVNDWASWSPYAVEELPLLEKVAANYEQKKVVVLAINRKEVRTQAERFLNTIPAIPHVKVIVDTNDFFYGATSGYAMPETLIYAADGTLVAHIRGVLKDDELRAQLDALVAHE
jgi:thiol-disulfide isomerase/thioredoxin